MEQTSLNIGTIGQKLETARQAKGVSVSEAGQATKILSKFIEAMEADDFGVLSAPVYARSFIKMYAKYLGLDATPLVEEYAAQNAPMTQSQLSDEVRQNLASADQVLEESPQPVVGEGKQVFGGVNQAIAKLSGNRFSPKALALAGGGPGSRNRWRGDFGRAAAFVRQHPRCLSREAGQNRSGEIEMDCWIGWMYGLLRFHADLFPRLPNNPLIQ